MSPRTFPTSSVFPGVTITRGVRLSKPHHVGNGVGTSSTLRLPRILSALTRMNADPELKLEKKDRPRPTKLMKRVWPSMFRRAEARKPRRPAKAQVDLILRDSAERPYLKLDNGQVIRATQGIGIAGQPAVLLASTPAQEYTLNAADQLQLAEINLPRLF